MQSSEFTKFCQNIKSSTKLKNFALKSKSPIKAVLPDMFRNPLSCAVRKMKPSSTIPTIYINEINYFGCSVSISSLFYLYIYITRRSIEAFRQGITNLIHINLYTNTVLGGSMILSICDSSRNGSRFQNHLGCRRRPIFFLFRRRRRRKLTPRPGRPWRPK